MNNKLLINDYITLLQQFGGNEYINNVIPNLENAIQFMEKQNVLMAYNQDYQLIVDKTVDSYQKEKIHPYVFSFYWIQKYCKSIEHSIKMDKLDLPFLVYGGVFPSGQFNAQAVTTENGVLLLLNDGLFMLIHRVLRFLSYDKNFGLIFGKEMFKTIKGSILERKILPRKKIAHLMAELILYYLFSRDPLSAPKYPRQKSPIIAAILENFVQATEKFALAHEYAHVILGHLNRNIKTQILINDKPLNIVKKNWEQEFDADQMAYMELLMGSLDYEFYEFYRQSNVGQLYLDRNYTELYKKISPEVKQDFEMKFYYSHAAYNLAPTIFFSIDLLINSILSQFSQIDCSQNILTHPPSDKRILKLLSTTCSAAYGEIDLKAFDLLTKIKIAEGNIAPMHFIIEWFYELQNIILRDFNLIISRFKNKYPNSLTK